MCFDIGLSEYYWTNDFNVLALPDIDSPSGDFTWLYNITDPSLSMNEPHTSSSFPKSAIVGIVIGSVALIVLVIITILMARKMRRSRGAATAAAWRTPIWEKR